MEKYDFPCGVVPRFTPQETKFSVGLVIPSGSNIGGGAIEQPLFSSVKSQAPNLEDKKHSHYFKDVSKIDTIDVYRVLSLFNVTDPCLQHAIKKLLVAGGRGAKDINKDVQEAIDTLIRYQVIRTEDYE